MQPPYAGSLADLYKGSQPALLTVGCNEAHAARPAFLILGLSGSPSKRHVHLVQGRRGW